MITADHRAPDVHTARLDRGGSQEGTDECRKEKLEADARLADPELRGEQHTGQRGEQPRGTKAPMTNLRTGMPLSAAAFGFAPMA